MVRAITEWVTPRSRLFFGCLSFSASAGRLEKRALTEGEKKRVTQ